MNLSLYAGGIALLFSQITLASENLENFGRDLTKIINSSKQSVVTITATCNHQPTPDAESGIHSFFKQQDAKTAESRINIGSGLIFDDQGHIITRNSIIADSDSLYVSFTDGKKLRATLKGQDFISGFAVLKVNQKTRPALFSELAQNESAPTFIIGNSNGIFPSINFTILHGILDDGMLQISNSLIPGNNGAPLINLNGKVIGLLAGHLLPHSQDPNQRPFSATEMMAIAYPAEWIRRIGADLIEYGHIRRGWLGIVGFNDDSRPKVKAIKNNSPAQKAGLQKGDLILKFIGRDVHYIEELARLVEFTIPGQPVPLEYQRGDETKTVNIELGERQQLNSGKIETAPYYGEPAFAAPVQNRQPMQSNTEATTLQQRINRLEHELSKVQEQIKAIHK